MSTLRVTTCMADNTTAVTAAIARHLGEVLDIDVRVIDDWDWSARYAGIAAGAIDVAWICGWPFAQFISTSAPAVGLLAVPVHAGARYGDAPVYFSDVIVRVDSPVTTLDELEGRTFAFNEVDSMSGWLAVRRHLRALQVQADFFGTVTETGAHVASIRAVLEGQADAAAIDSTVWEWQCRQNPALPHDLRVVATIGPTPAPPWVVNRELAPDLRQRLRDLLLHLHTHEAGRRILATGQVRRFDRGETAAYVALGASVADGALS